METQQTKFWQGDFGDEYTLRNTRNQQEWDQFYLDYFGITKIKMNEKFTQDWKMDYKILEVGCNTGMQLNGLQLMGFSNLYGIELTEFATEKAKENTKGINIINASGFDIPFKDNYFDVVCTNGVLIHISPNDLKQVMSEMVRCSSKYIWGFEYYSEEFKSINYRGNSNYLWKGDYANIFLEHFPNLKLVKKEFFPYINDSEKGNVDFMYLLEKI